MTISLHAQNNIMIWFTMKKSFTECRAARATCIQSFYFYFCALLCKTATGF